MNTKRRYVIILYVGTYVTTSPTYVPPPKPIYNVYRYIRIYLYIYKIAILTILLIKRY